MLAFENDEEYQILEIDTPRTSFRSENKKTIFKSLDKIKRIHFPDPDINQRYYNIIKYSGVGDKKTKSSNFKDSSLYKVSLHE